MFSFKKNLSLNILYAEDETMIREPIQQTLENFFTCKSVENGLEALEEIKKNPYKYDLIITDIMMPKMNGLDLAKNVRELNPEIPIIVTTAFSESSYLMKSIELGINRFVLKPLDVIVLLETINQTFEPILLKKEKIKKEKAYQQKLLEQAKYAAIGELAAGITHEINTPLTYMKSSFEIIEMDIDELEDSKQKDSIKEDITIIKEGFQRIENIIFSMKEIIGSDTKIRKQTNIFNTLLVALNIAYNKSKHITNIYINDIEYLKLEKDSFNFFTSLNPAKIEQLWIIIINNALDELVKIDSYEKRKLNIYINQDDENIIIKFKDNAGGIKKEILNKIFEPFKSTKNSSGMGIGLSIAKKIITSHDGEIKAYNENNGAVFEVKVPLIKD